MGYAVDNQKSWSDASACRLREETERKKMNLRSNIDYSKTKYNRSFDAEFPFAKTEMSFLERYKLVLANKYTKKRIKYDPKSKRPMKDENGAIIYEPSPIRKDAAWLIGDILQASPEDYVRWEEEDKIAARPPQTTLNRWIRESLDYLKKEYGDNIISCNLHVDETSAHFQVYSIPITPKGTLNSKYFRSRIAKIERNERYAEAMKGFGLTLAPCVFDIEEDEYGNKTCKLKDEEVVDEILGNRKVRRKVRNSFHDKKREQKIAEDTRELVRKRDKAQMEVERLHKKIYGNPNGETSEEKLGLCKAYNYLHRGLEDMKQQAKQIKENFRLSIIEADINPNGKNWKTFNEICDTWEKQQKENGGKKISTSRRIDLIKGFKVPFHLGEKREWLKAYYENGKWHLAFTSAPKNTEAAKLKDWKSKYKDAYSVMREKRGPQLN